MAYDKRVLKSQIRIGAPISLVWSYVCDERRIAALFEGGCEAFFSSDNGETAGRLRLGEHTYKVRMRPYDALAVCGETRLALRLTRAEDGSTLATAAATFDSSDGVEIDAAQLSQLLNALAGASLRQYRAVQSSASQNVPAQNAAQQPSRVSSPQREQPRADETVVFKDNRKAPQKRAAKERGGVFWTLFGVLAFAAAACCIFGYFSKNNIAPVAAATASGSDSVSWESAKSVLVGEARADVESALGCTGSEYSGATLYCSNELAANSVPARQLLVRYENSKVSEATYLDLNNCTAVGAASGATGIEPSAEMSCDDIAALAGCGISMTRRYIKDGEEFVEVHFGYVDPFANFDPEWRGSTVVTINLTTPSARVDNWLPYDGCDPLMIDSLEGSPASAQYDSYTDFLADKFQSDRAMLMLKRYSRGDAFRVFGAMSEYDAGGGNTLYRVSSSETLPDGSKPLYEICCGFDTTGLFKLSSFANMRLFDKAGQLDKTDVAAVRRNMTYNEVRSLLQVLPSALYVNSNFYTLCYGAHVGTGEVSEQFELVVEIDINTGYVQNVYNNGSPASAQTPEAQTTGDGE